MEDKNCELLFQYLNSILHDKKIKELDIESLDKPYQKLGIGLKALQNAVEEMKDYSFDLSKGNLSGHLPGEDNFLCENLKNIHSSLNHMTCQAKQVAAGDYSQHISYLGEFSEAFNQMVEQLSERESLLLKEAQNEKRRAEMMEGYNELLVELTRKSNEWIIVVSDKTEQILYCSHKDGNFDANCCEKCDERGNLLQKILGWKSKDLFKKWEAQEKGRKFYHIFTIPVDWRGQDAHAHIVRDITEERRETNKLSQKAYRDPLTGAGNRLYFDEQMQMLLESKSKFAFCFMDLDGLKSVNDIYGHLEGDAYLCRFVNTVQKKIRENDLLVRLGGDEFCVVFLDCPKHVAKAKMEEIYKIFQTNGDGKYISSFSYGVIDIDEEKEECMLNEILERADSIMYQRKRENKEKYFKNQISE